MIYLGTIDNAGSDVKNNLNTSSPFVIPPGTIGLLFQPSAATMMSAVKLASDSAFAPASTAMAQLGGASSFNTITLPGDRMVGQALVTVAVRKTDAGAGTTKVFAI